MVVGLARALEAGALSADAVALEARKAAETAPPENLDEPSETPGPVEPVASLTMQPGHLPVDSRPPPSVTAYDELLRCSRKDLS